MQGELRNCKCSGGGGGLRGDALGLQLFPGPISPSKWVAKVAFMCCGWVTCSAASTRLEALRVTQRSPTPLVKLGNRRWLWQDSRALPPALSLRLPCTEGT